MFPLASAGLCKCKSVFSLLLQVVSMVMLSFIYVAIDRLMMMLSEMLNT